MWWFWRRKDGANEKISPKQWHDMLGELAEANRRLAYHRRRLHALNVARKGNSELAILHREAKLRQEAKKLLIEADLKIINSG